MNKKVLIITSPFRPNVGGVETHLDDLIRDGSKKGISFRVIAYQPLVTKVKGPFKEKLGSTIIYRIPWLRFNLFLKLVKYPILEFLYLFPGLFFGSFIYLFFNNKSISAIHSQGLVAGTVGVILGKIFSKRIIISTHSIYSFPGKGFYRKFVLMLFNNADQILTLSNQSKHEIENLGVDPKKVTVFTYWIDLDRFKPVSDKLKAKSKLGWKYKFVVLFVGRLIEEKGIMILLQAAKKWNKNITLAVIGTGPLEEGIKHQSLTINNLVYLGKINNDELPKYYNAADATIVPSIHEEGFGRVILESLACGIPVIASDRGAIPEVLDDTVSILIDVTANNLVNTIEYIFRNQDGLNKLACNARPYALKRYSQKNAEQIIKYYYEK